MKNIKLGVLFILVFSLSFLFAMSSFASDTNNFAVSPINKLSLTAGYKNATYKAEYGWTHHGTDMISKTGSTTLYAPFKMKIKAAGYDNKCGNVIVAVSENPVNIHYGTYKGNRRLAMRMYHLSYISSKVKPGAVINQQDYIGNYGNTGPYSFGAHLHIEFDRDINYPTYAPGLASSSNIIKKGTDSTVNPMDVLKIDTTGVFGTKQGFYYRSSQLPYLSIANDLTTYTYNGNVINATKY